MKDKSDAPAETHGDWPKTFTSSKKGQNYILLTLGRMGTAGCINKRAGEREFVKDFNSAELETMRISRNSTTVMTANGEVQTREQATVCVKELLDLSVTVMLLGETPAVLSLGKLSEDHGYTYH